MTLPTSPFIRALLTGLLAGAAFPQVLPLGWWGVLSFVAFVPLLLAIDEHAPKVQRRTIVAWCYVAFFVMHGLTNWWVCSWQERTDPYLFASGIALWIGHPFFLMLPFLVLASIRRRLGSLWMIAATPLAIAGFEWMHGQTDASYPWLTTGYDLVHTPFGQLAEWVGVYGLTLLIAIVNTVIVLLIKRRNQGRTVLRPLLALIAGILAWGVMGKLLANAAEYPSSDIRPLDVFLVQPNEDPWDKWSDPAVQVRAHQRLTDSTITAVGHVPDLVVWSETAIPFTIREPRNVDEWEQFRRWIDSSRVTLLTGYADMLVYPPGQAPPSARRATLDPNIRFDAFNAAMVLTPGATTIPVHRKSMLTPFAERLPFADQLTFAMSWIEWGVGISAWGKGRTRHPLPVGKANVGTIICIESIYPEVATDLVENGADVLCVITNDAWYNGTWGPEQHYDIARMRAIEQRRDVLRCANSGVTGRIRADGSDPEHPAIRPMTSGVAQVFVHPRSGRTVYSIIGDPLPIGGLICTLLLFFSARIPFVLRNLPFRFTSLENSPL